jgi:hypothetical protein
MKDCPDSRAKPIGVDKPRRTRIGALLDVGALVDAAVVGGAISHLKTPWYYGD